MNSRLWEAVLYGRTAPRVAEPVIFDGEGVVNLVVALGLVAGSLTTFAWLPQILRIYRHQRADDIAWGYLTVIALGISLWIFYGAWTHSLPVLIANVVSDLLVATVIVKKFQLGQRESP